MEFFMYMYYTEDSISPQNNQVQKEVIYYGQEVKRTFLDLGTSH